MSVRCTSAANARVPNGSPPLDLHQVADHLPTPPRLAIAPPGTTSYLPDARRGTSGSARGGALGGGALVPGGDGGGFDGTDTAHPATTTSSTTNARNDASPRPHAGGCHRSYPRRHPPLPATDSHQGTRLR
ncbi:hypothetical protein ACFSTC_30620 [Nonomuraea ferruginea]